MHILNWKPKAVNTYKTFVNVLIILAKDVPAIHFVHGITSRKGVILLDKKLLQNLSNLLSKMPKKDLEKNFEKAKAILKNSKKEDLQNLLSNPQLSKILGKHSLELKNQLENINIDEINLDELENKLK